MAERRTTPPGRATIADVARQAGVAKSTVSNYLRGVVRVAPKTGVRIARAIEALDYQPAECARSLTARKRTAPRLDRIEQDVPALTTVGHVSVDFIARLDGLPAPAERTLAQGILKAVGGPAANVAAFAAGLSDRWTVAASLLTEIGNDVDSDWAVTELARRGVETLTPSGRREGRLARALVLVEPDGRRTIVAEPVTVGAMELDLFLAAQDRPTRPWCMHFEGFQIPGHLDRVLAARAAGFRTSMDTTGLAGGWLGDRWSEVLAAVDVLVIQPESLAGLTERAPMTEVAEPEVAEPEAAAGWIAASLAQARRRPEVVILADPAGGAFLIEPNRPVSHCAAPDLEVRDETGAADALVGTFLALWMHGVPTGAALEGACAAAARVATAFGAQELRPTGADLADRLEAAGAADTTARPHPPSRSAPQ